MNGWSQVQLQDVAELTGGYAFKSSEYSENGTFVLRTLNIQDDCSISRENSTYVPDALADQYKRFSLAGNDTLFVMVGATLGKVGFIRSSDLPALLNQNMWRVRAKSGMIDPLYLHYCFRHFCRGPLEWVSGSARGFVRRDDYRQLRIPLPSAKEQREIASILGALDDKIELNRRMSATLEDMARSLYRSWFVDFDPVHAKMEGRLPAFMDEATSALFPDRFGDDGLPEGWHLGSVADVFDVVMGQSPPGNTYNEDGEGLPFYQGRTDFGFRFPTRRKYCSAPTRIAAKDSVLLSVRAPVGDLNRAWEECCIGRGVASLSEKSGRNAYGYEAIWALSEDLKSYDSEGTVFGSINKKQLADLKIVTPTVDLQAAFEAIVKPMDDQVRNNTANNQTLVSLRDSLLPKLMSGEIRVGEAREQIEAVA